MKRLLFTLVLICGIATYTHASDPINFKPTVSSERVYLPPPNPSRPEGIFNERELIGAYVTAWMPNIICCGSVINYEWTIYEFYEEGGTTTYTFTTTNPTIYVSFPSPGLYDVRVRILTSCGYTNFGHRSFHKRMPRIPRGEF